jgi:hypothetical protein
MNLLRNLTWRYAAEALKRGFFCFSAFLLCYGRVISSHIHLMKRSLHLKPRSQLLVSFKTLPKSRVMPRQVAQVTAAYTDSEAEL